MLCRGAKKNVEARVPLLLCMIFGTFIFPILQAVKGKSVNPFSDQSHKYLIFIISNLKMYLMTCSDLG
jgi:hypothetical protein